MLISKIVFGKRNYFIHFSYIRNNYSRYLKTKHVHISDIQNSYSGYKKK